MKKKIFTLFLTAIMVMAMSSSLVMAETIPSNYNGEISTYSTGAVDIGYKRLSDTTASGSVRVEFMAKAKEFMVTVTLQEKHGSTWETNYNISGAVTASGGRDSSFFFDTFSWKGLKKGYLYRLRVTAKDTQQNGLEYISTSYSEPF